MSLRTNDDRTWRGARVTVMGLGLFGGGVGATRFAASLGAKVTVTDLRGAAQLGESLEALAGLPVRYVLGRHEDADFREADLVIVNPAVPMNSPYLGLARSAGVPLTTEMLLFAERCAGRVVAVSGSNGKTTTTSLVGAILSAYDRRTVVGGNLGRSLLMEARNVERGAPVILEVSSFQLEWLGPTGWYPEIGVLTNLSPNHLDRHGTYEAYVAAKRELLAHQPPQAYAVLNAQNEGLRAMAAGLPGRIVWFDGKGEARPGARVEGETIVFEREGKPVGVVPLDEIPLVGYHNRENVLAAVAAASTWGVPPRTIRSAVRRFTPVAHRLEFVREVGGVRYYNDSIATTPESAICALRSFEPRQIVLIAGGYDKKIPFDDLGREIAARAAGLVLLGTTAEKIARAAEAAGFPAADIHRVGALADAVALAARLARPGQVVSLSPACASYDQFRNFEERGILFKKLVSAL
jgi:UDP-N-acetylmuramoylalanine--D-glutamate ligase